MSGGAGLFMDLGTGKSLVAIALAANFNFKRTLILTPKSVVTTEVWPKEFQKHVPNQFEVLQLTDKKSLLGRAHEMWDFLQATTKPAVIVINWEALSSPYSEPLRQVILQSQFQLCIADEIQRIKAPGSKISLFCRKLANVIPHRLGLTGTPIAESPLDIYGEYRFLEPSIFGTNFARFRDNYAVMGGYGGKEVLYYKNEEKLAEKMYSIAFRVDNAVLNLSVPVDIERRFDLNPKAHKIYNELKKKYITWIDESVLTASNILSQMIRLQQLTSGFLPVGGVLKEIDDSRKQLLEEVLSELSSTEPVVVFARFTEDIKNIKQVFTRLGRKCLERSGQADEVMQWQNGEGVGLVVQIGSGSSGIDLTRARYAIYYSLSFSLNEYEQSRGRLNRPGQRRRVTYVHLLSNQTIDESILHALQTKQEISSYLLNELRR